MTNAPQTEIRTRLIDAMGGMEAFTSGWIWRSFERDRRAQEALNSACAYHADAMAVFANADAPADQVSLWEDRFIKKWCAYQHAGARTANPMITGPANFPVRRNQKAMETEQKRYAEYIRIANGADYFLRKQKRSAERAAASEQAKGVDHKEQLFGDVRLVHNEPLDRLQLIFPDKPADDERAILKKNGWRWSPREGAWQRKLTQNAKWAAERTLKLLGRDTGMHSTR